MARNFLIPDARDPNTGEDLGAGYIKLMDHQRRIIRAGLARHDDGSFQWVTFIYSAIKKSGKTRLVAGIVSWYAMMYGEYNEVYCMANDGKQSSDRLLSAVKQSIQLAKRDEFNSDMADWHVTKTRITLPNGTFIEAIPCDASGQAGSNPGLTAWSELWGYRERHKERLWSEMTIPPTRWGRAIRIVESYAGFSGESMTLQNLHEIGVKDGVKHPRFPDMPVYYNAPAKIIAYWDHEPRMPWQTPEYYAEEATVLEPSEFERMHRNRWVDPINKLIPSEWWNACQDVVRDGEPLPPLDKYTPVVLACDASVSHDSVAAVLVSRHPTNPRHTAVRNTQVWYPPKGGKIDLTETLEEHVKEVCGRYNIVKMVYDEYQLHKMATDLRKEIGVWATSFGQSSDRTRSDKMLYDMIVSREIVHQGDPELNKHINNVHSKNTGTGMRFVKPDSTTVGGVTKRPIDCAVALSMGNYECMRLNLG
jgi:phage terminase large subunit-like protein